VGRQQQRALGLLSTAATVLLPATPQSNFVAFDAAKGVRSGIERPARVDHERPDHLRLDGTQYVVVGAGDDCTRSLDRDDTGLKTRSTGVSAVFTPPEKTMTNSLVAIVSSQQRCGAGANTNLGYTDTPMLPGLPYHVHDPARPHPASSRRRRNRASAVRRDRAVRRPRSLDSGRRRSRHGKSRTATSKSCPTRRHAHEGRSSGTCSCTSSGPLPLKSAAQSEPRQQRHLPAGRYEVQVLDSFDNPTYADGQAGAIYGQWPPLVNPVRRPGEWQSYRHRLRGRRASMANASSRLRISRCFSTACSLHHHKEVMGPTVHRALAKYVRNPQRTARPSGITSSPCAIATSGYAGSEEQDPPTTVSKRVVLS
jgi:hypothetical protein